MNYQQHLGNSQNVQLPKFSANCPPELQENLIAPYETLYVYIDKHGEVFETTVPPEPQIVQPYSKHTYQPVAPNQRVSVLQNQQLNMTQVQNRLHHQHLNSPAIEPNKYNDENRVQTAIHASSSAETLKKDPPKPPCKNCIYVLDREIEGEHGYACYERSEGGR